eukprot:Gregarina_sp_Poly_1__9298@NODE_576_length_7467_cov_130_013649_g450_i0_p4_GENE_NODE_576_length_7467_cov_130_013649_g450_i0NODE_576_length_7467_cov_130_013649_g450_i0_p4_ORF_typecomplete_len298_score38_04Yip1/PF04893_17/8e20WW/PF00397_26/1_6e07YIF1/PF03878_15/1_8e06PGG/PF13962_6/38PGG/PF13962_6/19DUF2569/PF10754_9/79DUF2569/PF10754_9/2_9_NODE_576_length_7467_cov_130_013649_g450_i064987391
MSPISLQISSLLFFAMLPEGWTSYKTEDGMEYYHNATLNITQWDRPIEPSLIGVKLQQDFLPSTATSTTATDLESGKQSPNLEVLDSAKQSALRYFDVTTNDIKERLVLATLPYRLWGSDSQDASIFAQKPDLYGPVWICITASFALFAGGHAYAWASNMLYKTHFITLYVSLIVSAVWLLGVPLAIRAASVWNGAIETAFKLEHVMCVYGYSLLPTIPLSILCSLPSKLLQIIFTLAALALSLVFLGITLFKDLHQVPQRVRVWLAAIITVSQLAYFMLVPIYFFRLSPSPLVSLE